MCIVVFVQVENVKNPVKQRLKNVLFSHMFHNHVFHHFFSHAFHTHMCVKFCIVTHTCVKRV